MTAPRKPRSFTLSAAPEDIEILEEIAQKYECMWGKQPIISELLRQIAQGKLKIVPATGENRKRERLNNAINKAFATLLEIQQIIFGE